MQIGDKAGAIADFRKALELSPGLRTASESLQRLGAAISCGARGLIFAAGPLQGGVGFLGLLDDIRRRSGRVWA
jgi:hypothetical protein